MLAAGGLVRDDRGRWSLTAGGRALVDDDLVRAAALDGLLSWNTDADWLLPLLDTASRDSSPAVQEVALAGSELLRGVGPGRQVDAELLRDRPELVVQARMVGEPAVGQVARLLIGAFPAADPRGGDRGQVGLVRAAQEGLILGVDAGDGCGERSTG